MSQQMQQNNKSSATSKNQHYQSARDMAPSSQPPHQKKKKHPRPSSKQKQYESDENYSGNSDSSSVGSKGKRHKHQQHNKDQQPIIHSEKNRMKRIIGDASEQQQEQISPVRGSHYERKATEGEAGINSSNKKQNQHKNDNMVSEFNHQQKPVANSEKNQKSLKLQNNQNNPPQQQHAQSDSSSEQDAFPSDPDDFVNCFGFADDNDGDTPEGDEHDLHNNQQEEVKLQATIPQSNNNNEETKLSHQQLKAHRQQLVEASQEDDDDGDDNNSYQSSSSQSEMSEDQSIDNFHDNPDEDDDHNQYDSNSQTSYRKIGASTNQKSPLNNKYLAPLEFARSHVAKIEQDMKRMHERHVSLMREMEDNYKMIEQETQEYYIEFLSKWKELARKKITQYRKAIETLAAEKEQIVKTKDLNIDALNDRIINILKEKEHIVREHYEDLKMRDDEIERQRQDYDDKINKKDKEKQQLVTKIDDKDHTIHKLQVELKELKQVMAQREEQQEIEFETLQQRCDDQKKEFEIQLDSKINVNEGLEADLKKLKQQFDKLQQQYDASQLKISQSQNMSILSNSGAVASGNVITINKSKFAQNVIPASNILVKNPTDLDTSGGNKSLSLGMNNLNNSSVVQKVKKFKLNGIILQKPTGNQTQGPLKKGNNLAAVNQTQDQIANYHTSDIHQQDKSSLQPLQALASSYMTQNQQHPTHYQQELQIQEIENKKNELIKEIKVYEEQKYAYKKIIMAWQKEQKLANGGVKPEAKKSDPIYKDYQQYQMALKMITEKNQTLSKLNGQQQQIYSTNQGDQSQNQDQLQQQIAKQNQSTSARGSRSMSPRKQASINHMQPGQGQDEFGGNQEQDIKQSPNKKGYNQNQKSPPKSIVEKLEQQLEFITKERDMFKRSLQNLSDSSQALTDYTQLMNALSHQINLGSQISATNSGIGSNTILSQDGSKIGEANSFEQQQQALNRVLSENKMLRESLKKLENSLKLMAVIYKQQTAIIQMIRERNTEMHKSQNQSTTSDSFDKNNQINEQMIASIEDRIRKEQHQQLVKLEQEAKKGMEQREEIIKKLQQERNNLRKQVKDSESRVEESQQESIIAKSQLEKIREECSVGETLLQNQIKEIKTQNVHLWAKYEYETLQRKKLHNILEDMKGKIRVFCRVRPMNSSELQMASPPVITITDQFTLKIHLKQGKVSYGQQLQNNMIGNGSGETNASGYINDKEFNFDSCFGPKSTQEQVFEDTKMLIQSAIDGYNVCLFAYGQTGSGKTYTIQGTDTSPGIVPRALQELFDIKQRMENDNHYTITLECYMVELYLDNLNDLLSSANAATSSFGKAGTGGSQKVKLDIREDPQSGMVYIHNVTKQALFTIQDAQSVYDKGIKSRKVASTNMNEQSSRSHLVYSVVVDTFNNETKQRTRGKISFVDLAGSERHDKANTNKERLKEASAINQSLKSLGDVIQNLANGSHRTHVPYRDNKLTHLMKDSLGGNSKTLMFVNISPADYNFSETKMSLYYGERVKQIQNEVSKNVESQELIKLREENERLKMQVSTATKSSTIAATNKSMSKN